jgi:CheY-like chemotaxis protein
MNLVLNASDAMPRGGQLSVTTGRIDVDGDAARMDPNAREGPHVCICVRDTGQGIDPEDLERIFDPFFTTKGVGRGTGLGLASAHGIITSADGHIRVESSREGGTTFHVNLPLVEAAAADEAVVPALRDEASRVGTILLCEDDAAVRRITQRSLEAGGHRVYAVDRAEAAIDWLQSHREPIDLLISDVILPGMNGVELVRAVTERWPAVRVLLISGYTANVLERSGVPADVELLEKPFSPELLLARVEAQLRAGPPA